LRVNKIGFAKKTKKLKAKSARIGVYETSGAVKISIRSRKENMVAFHDFSHTALHLPLKRVAQSAARFGFCWLATLRYLSTSFSLQSHAAM
jgi:hypothetical protein